MLTLPAGALADGASAPAVSAAKVFANETLRLDSHRATAANHGIVRTRQRLRSGQRYTMTVKGTASYYAPAAYTAPRHPLVLCGTPEPAAMFRSPGAVNGPVGVDPEFVFARPWTRSQCGRVPGHWSNFQIKRPDARRGAQRSHLHLHDHRARPRSRPPTRRQGWSPGQLRRLPHPHQSGDSLSGRGTVQCRRTASAITGITDAESVLSTFRARSC